MAPRVVILGGGVAGMSAAHELIERGFQVDIYERTGEVGGKARSVGKPGTGSNDDLPGEHGFRFFPRFYRHVTDTMKRIPHGPGRSVADNLMKATEHAIAFAGGEPFVFPLRLPWRRRDWRIYVEFAQRCIDLGLTKEDMSWFGWRVWQLLTMSDQRTAEEYERVGWWEFVDADNRSKAFQYLLAGGPTRTLIAAQPETASTQVGGRILLELLYAICTPSSAADQVLNAPTRDSWLDPWYHYLEEKGVRFHFGSHVTQFHCLGGKITGVTVRVDGRDVRVTGDYYVAALPVEAMGGGGRKGDDPPPLINGDMERADPTLSGIREIATHVGWMNGVQFYLDRELPVAHGHVTYIDSPWALTSISQKQFWQGVDLKAFGAGTVRDILSVDVSDWITAVPNQSPRARECTSEQEVLDEVWTQVKDRLPAGASRLHSRLDPEISFDKTQRPLNAAKLFVNRSNSWRLRPDAYTRIPNLFLASDYVRTFTSLASMEAANEAARRAVNAILTACPDVPAPLCDVWPLRPPWHIRLLLRALRHADARDFARGIPYQQRNPWWLQLGRWVFLTMITYFAKKTRDSAGNPILKG